MRSSMRNYRTAIVFLLFAPAAFALNNRSAVSVNGVDTNPCTTTSPCRSFGAAIAVTNPGGEIIALDSAGYGPFTINAPMTVSGAPGVHAAISVTSGEGITVGTPSFSDRVIVRNLVLIGAGGTVGIHQMNYTGDLRVIGCLIRGFSTAGINNDANGGSLSVHRTSVLDNPAASGIVISGGFIRNNVTITDCSIQGNNAGVDAEYNTAVVVAHSTITGNATGALVESDNVNIVGGFAANLVLEACTIAHNTTGISATSTGATNINNTATVYASQNVIAFNGNGVTSSATSGGVTTVYSFLNNRFEGNGADGGPLTTIALK
jgi:hypothetical protein